jgi:hypothetical protein
MEVSGGTLRSLFEDENWHYKGVDIRRGPGVDIVIEHPGSFWPNLISCADVVLSSSHLEHDPVFWFSFSMMARMLRTRGHMYCCVPSRGPYHPHPIDCWRFQADAWKAMALWAPELELVEYYIDGDETWKDNVGIFRRR